MCLLTPAAATGGPDVARVQARYARRVIVAAALCPPAPLLVPGLAVGLAVELDDLVAACRKAVGRLAGADRIVVVSVGIGRAAGRRLAPGTVVSAAPFSRSDHPATPTVRLPYRPASSGPSGDAGRPGTAEYDGYDAVPADAGSDGRGTSAVSLTAGSIVAAYLLDAGAVDAPTFAYQLPHDADPADATRMFVDLDPTVPTGFLAMANGAAAHSEHAPGGDDPRSRGFDADLVTAMSSGDPAQLADTCRVRAGLAAELHDETLPALAALAELARGSGAATAEMLHYSAPLGIGYLVATWQWAAVA